MATLVAKPVRWMGSCREDIRAFPESARKRAGYELYVVQQGLMPSDWKPMNAVAAGVQEIRVHTEREHRVLYIAKFEESIYVQHAFEKKTQRTPIGDIDIARLRLKTVLVERRARTKRGN